MRQRIVNLKKSLEAIRPFLEIYLQEQGIDTTKNFTCIDPKHKDKNPSMSCKGDPSVFVAHCFSCHASFDIFSVAHFLEGKPLKGPNFIEENVLYLADKYGVKIDLEDLTPEELYEFKTYEAYRYASELISDRTFGNYENADKEIERRGWDKEKIAEWGIGTVNYEEYKSRMKNAGYDVSFLTGVDLDRSTLFNHNNLLFTVHDDYGRPVGFSAKNLRHTKEDKTSGPKYLNTKGTSLECAIFKKGERLYGLDLAREIHGPLYIFEGQADVISGRSHGIMNCCCTLGTSFSTHHINLLKRHGLFNIIMVFDGDDAGEEAVLKALDTKFTGEREFRIKLIQLPNGDDPDQILREYGRDYFIKLKQWSAFEWRMMQFIETAGEDIDEDTSKEIAEKMSNIIASESSYLKQEIMAKQVAKVTGFSIQAIIAEVKRIRNEKEYRITEKKTAAVESLLYNIKSRPDDLELALTECQNTVQQINKETQDFSGSFTSIIINQKEHDENRSAEFAGFKMRPDGLAGIASRLDDDWTTGNLVFIGGGAQAGKTTLATQIAYEIATENEDTMCIYHSIDDAAKFIIYKWICQASNNLKLELNHVSSPNYWISQGLDFIAKEREEAYRKILHLAQEEKLVLFDATHGSSLVFAETIVKKYRENYPSRKIVLFCDNFHKYPDYGNIQGHERPKKLSNHLKNMTVANDITVVSTVEYKKLTDGELPSNQAIAETRALSYDATVILHLYNDLHHKGERSELIHMKEDGTMLPRIWCKFGKNKVSGYEGREFLDLYPSNASYRCVELKKAIEEIKERATVIKEQKRSHF